MFILDSGKYAAGADAVQKEVLGAIERVGGKVLASRPWQDTKLAYAIEKHRRGVYFLTYFELESTKVVELERLMKFVDSVIRHLVLAVEPELVQPMLNVALGTGEIVSSFHDTENALAGMTGGGDRGGRSR
jgi:small subunit ribosomal protein S6